LATEILPREVRATKRQLQFYLMLPASLPTTALISTASRLRVPVCLKWNGRNQKMLIKNVKGLCARGLLQEVVLLLSPSWIESLDRTLSELARIGAPSVSLQMEYAHPWSLYDYYLLEQTIRRLHESGWRMGSTEVLLGEPMCRKAPGASYCGAGVTKVAIASDGMLYPCHRFVGDRRWRASRQRRRAIGTAALGFWPGVLGLHRYRPEQNEGCHGCSLLSRCDTGCIWHNLHETSRIDKTTSAVCEFTKMLYRET
jgi:radical SAM protein with 4Fe4S-binding SPASM domain